MARVALEEFNDQEVARIYFAAKLSEAEEVEMELQQNNIDYAVEVEPYRAMAVFWVSEYKGAAFYVPAAQADFCRRILAEAGLKAGLMEEKFW